MVLFHKMLIELCGDNQKKWNEVYIVGKNCLENRVRLWDSILDQIVKKNSITHHQESLVNA